MPIVTTQRRMAEHGRIRLGQKVATRSGKTRPDKLDRFRFTSPNQRLIEEIAGKYGGQARPWDNSGKAEWEVISDARSIPVIVVKGGFSQWHELWSKAGCLHRCDGEKDVTGEMCDPKDPQHLQAIEKPTTRLSVMLSEIETLGVWRMESKGWNAAAELPSMAELAMHVGDLVPATLSLAERSSIVETPRGPQTSRYVVPMLDLHVTKARLVEIAGGVGGVPQLEAGSAPSAAKQIEAPKPDYDALIAAAQSRDQLNVIWRQAGEAGDLTDALKAAIVARGNAVQPPAPAADEPVDAEVIDGSTDVETDTAAAWMNVVTVAGQNGWSMYDLEDAFAAHTGVSVPDASGQQITDFLAALRRGDIKAA